MENEMRVSKAVVLICCSLVGLLGGRDAAATPLNPPDEAKAETQPAVAAQPFFFALSVSDVERSSRWYQRVLGFEVARTIDLPERGFKIELLQKEGGFLELTENRAARSLKEVDSSIEKRHLVHGVFKIGFVIDELDDAIAKLAALEVPLRGKVITESDGSMRSLQVEDPDGNVLQLFELLDGS